jgi:hypothetical protein
MGGQSATVGKTRPIQAGGFQALGDAARSKASHAAWFAWSNAFRDSAKAALSASSGRPVDATLAACLESLSAPPCHAFTCFGNFPKGYLLLLDLLADRFEIGFGLRVEAAPLPFQDRFRVFPISSPAAVCTLAAS